MSWEEFSRAIRSHFFTEHHYDAKRTEFITLRQGWDMTVSVYHQKFIELMYYASDVVSDEDRKVRRFKEGLLPEICICCTYVRGMTLSDMYSQALTVEQGKNEERQRQMRQWQIRGPQRRGGSQRRSERGQSSRASTLDGSHSAQSSA